MRQPVICKNCGIKWEQVIAFGEPLELTENLMYNCPNCNSNYCEPFIEPLIGETE